MGEACLADKDIRTSLLDPRSVSISPNFAWYVLRTRVGGEMAATDTLRYRGLAPYCPMQKERRRYTDRIKIVERAIFPGYVFCQFDLERKLPVISCPGVEYIVGFAEGPVSVPEDEVRNIRRMIVSGASAVRSLSPGQRVRVTHGPLEGVEGVLVRDSSGDRLVVSIRLLSQGASLHIDQDLVCPVGQAI